MATSAVNADKSLIGTEQQKKKRKMAVLRSAVHIAIIYFVHLVRYRPYGRECLFKLHLMGWH